MTRSSSEPTKLDSKRKRGRPVDDTGLDPFTMDNHSGYDPNEFYCRSTDGHGHAENLQVRIPPEISSTLAALVQGKTIPAYGTSQSFVRDAIVHRLWWIANKYDDSEIQRQVLLEIRAAQLDRMQAEMESMNRTMANFERLVETARLAHDVDMLGRLSDHISQTLELMREPYHGQLAKIGQSVRRIMMQEADIK